MKGYTVESLAKAVADARSSYRAAIFLHQWNFDDVIMRDLSRPKFLLALPLNTMERSENTTGLIKNCKWWWRVGRGQGAYAILYMCIDITANISLAVNISFLVCFTKKNNVNHKGSKLNRFIVVCSWVSLVCDR